MKTTGIVRRIDELGRIVIPKEIRKTLRIKDGENLEICINDKDIVLRKFSLMKKVEDFAQNFTDGIYSFLKKNIIITNRDTIIAVSGSLRKDYLNQEISESLNKFIDRRESILEKYKKKIELVNGIELEGTYAISSIIVNGDSTGLVIIYDDVDAVNEVDYKIIQIVSSFLSKYLEE